MNVDLTNLDEICEGDVHLDAIEGPEFVTKWSSKLCRRLGNMDRHGNDDGPFALISWCGEPVFSLHPTAKAAETVKAFLDSSGCGGQCIRDHQIIDMRWEDRNDVR